MMTGRLRANRGPVKREKAGSPGLPALKAPRNCDRFRRVRGRGRWYDQKNFNGAQRQAGEISVI